MREQVLQLLKALGVTGADQDPILDFVIKAATNTIKNATNQPAIPDGLVTAAVYNATGQYLTFVKSVGKLKIDGLDFEQFEGVVKQIQEGDTNVVFAVGEGDTPEGRLDGLISWLNGYGREQWNRFRRLVW